MVNIFQTAKNTYSYETFVAPTEKLLSEGKATGNHQSDSYLHYTRLNLQRMKRWEKTFDLQDNVARAMKEIQPQQWWLITEGWCGDSAQNLPALKKMVDASEGRITLHIVLRDENPDIMDQYLTNGTSRSIPILAAFDMKNNFLFRWGPRPKAAQALLYAWKNNPDPPSHDDFEKEMHTWYAKNKGIDIQDEIMQLLQN